MSPDALTIVGLVAVLLPTLYFLIASPTFLLAKFEDPIVTKLFRDLLSFHFKLIFIGSVLGSLTSVFAGRWGGHHLLHHCWNFGTRGAAVAGQPNGNLHKRPRCW
jgi:hypothetical protein